MQTSMLFEKHGTSLSIHKCNANTKRIEAFEKLKTCKLELTELVKSFAKVSAKLPSLLRVGVSSGLV